MHHHSLIFSFNKANQKLTYCTDMDGKHKINKNVNNCCVMVHEHMTPINMIILLLLRNIVQHAT